MGAGEAWSMDMQFGIPFSSMNTAGRVTIKILNVPSVVPWYPCTTVQTVRETSWTACKGCSGVPKPVVGRN